MHVIDVTGDGDGNDGQIYSNGDLLHGIDVMAMVMNIVIELKL